MQGLLKRAFPRKISLKGTAGLILGAASSAGATAAVIRGEGLILRRSAPGLLIYILLLCSLRFFGCNSAPVPAEKVPEVLSKEDAVKFFDQAILYNRAKDRTRAINSYTVAITADPLFQSAYFQRGATYYSLEKYTEAIKDFDRALLLGLEDATETFAAYSLRGASYSMLGKYEEAVTDLTKALERADEKNAYLKKAAADREKGQ